MSVEDMTNKRTLQKIMLSIINDQFDDVAQNENVWEGFADRNILEEFFARNRRNGRALDIGCGSGDSLYHLDIGYALEPHPDRFVRTKDKFKNDDRVEIKQGWAENIPWPDEHFDTVMSWGTMMFVRSMMEALIEVNRVLTHGGIFVFDVVTYTTMPIAQTVDRCCFPKYVEILGFRNVEVRPFGDRHYKRIAVATQKVAIFDPRSLQLPQISGDIRNFWEARDWYLR